MGHEQETRLKASRMHIYVRRGGPNYQTGLARMRALGEELGVPLEVTKHTYGVLACCRLRLSTDLHKD